ncbi:uncharacterized protein LOC5504274 [Nematostella vectensis]|uniref:uncharacterized protein LOC5504274 n=1 Tax=Nematostella vectensis TaxID=45351 RepID=UPI00207743DB|nr:uncharacterized protein LOC5504274 [Nematostella vectensis]XP_048582538.1 uncharacterized protein LOC5504274 [Nematostella vectensis]
MAEEESLTIVSLETPPVSEVRRESRNWTDAETAKLITLWEGENVLYNGRHKDHFRRECRSAAMDRIQQRLAEDGDLLFTLEELHKKMRCLRTYYSKEIKKEKISKLNSSNPQDLYTSRWPLYHSLHFLKDYINSKQSLSSSSTPLNTSKQELDCTADSDDQAVLASDNVSNVSQESSDFYESPAIPPIANNMKRTANTDRDLFNNCGKQTKKSEEPEFSCEADNAFGHYVANQLMRIPDGLPKEMLKIEIQQSIVKVLHPKQTGLTTEYDYNYH